MGNFERVKEAMSEEGKFLRFCPTCNMRRFVKTFINDDIADFYCPNCMNYHKNNKDEGEETVVDIMAKLDELIEKYNIEVKGAEQGEQKEVPSGVTPLSVESPSETPDDFDESEEEGREG